MCFFFTVQIFLYRFFSFFYKVHQPPLSFLPFSCPSCPSSSSQLDVIWPVNGTLLCSLLSGRLSRCHEQPQHWSLHKVGSLHSAQGCKLHPANTQTLCAQLSFSSLEHHWRSIAYPDFVWVKTSFRQRGKWPLWCTTMAYTKRSCTDSWALNFLPRHSWGQQLGGRRGQPAVRGHLLVNCWSYFDWVPVARLPHSDWRWYSTEGSGEAKFRSNIWIFCSFWVCDNGKCYKCLLNLQPLQNKTETITKDLPTMWRFIWTKLQTNLRS